MWPPPWWWRSARWRYLSPARPRHGPQAARQLLDSLPPEEAPQDYELGWIGIGLLRRGRADEAEALARMTVDVFPDSPDAHLRLAQALLQRGDDGAAAEHARTARRLLDEGAEVPGWAAEGLRNGIEAVLAAAPPEPDRASQPPE